VVQELLIFDDECSNRLLWRISFLDPVFLRFRLQG